MSAAALAAVLERIQVLEHERQWCEMEDVSEVEPRLETAVNDLMALLCPHGQEEDAPLPAVSGLLAQPAPAQAEALREENERLRELVAALDAQQALREKIRNSPPAPHTDYWHQSLYMAQDRVGRARAALAAAGGS